MCGCAGSGNALYETSVDRDQITTEHCKEGDWFEKEIGSRYIRH
jgi:hypothetical protein